MKKRELKELVQEVIEEVLNEKQVCESNTRNKFYAKLWSAGHNTTYAASGRNVVTIRSYETKKDRDNDVRNYTAPNHTPSATIEPTTANDPDVRRALKNGDILTWDDDYKEWMLDEVKTTTIHELKELVQEVLEEVLNEKQVSVTTFSTELHESEKEFPIWGIPPGAKREELLYTKAKSHAEAKKIVKILTDKHGVTKARIQVLDLAQNPADLWNSEKLLNELKSLIREVLCEVNSDILNEGFVNLLMKDEDAKRKYADDVWDILQHSYEKIGGIRGTGFGSKEEMIKTIPFWKLAVKSGQVKAVAMYKDKSGRKSVAIGTDGSDWGKQKLAAIFKDDIKRAYSEKSKNALGFLLKQYPKEVLTQFLHTPSQVAKISKKEIIPVTDVPNADLPEDAVKTLKKYPWIKDYGYFRKLNDTLVFKVMVGTPGKTIK